MDKSNIFSPEENVIFFTHYSNFGLMRYYEHWYAGGVRMTLTEAAKICKIGDEDLLWLKLTYGE